MFLGPEIDTVLHFFLTKSALCVPTKNPLGNLHMYHLLSQDLKSEVPKRSGSIGYLKN